MEGKEASPLPPPSLPLFSGDCTCWNQDPLPLSPLSSGGRACVLVGIETLPLPLSPPMFSGGRACVLVGPAGCGKTLAWRTLIAALHGAAALADPSVLLRLYPEVWGKCGVREHCVGDKGRSRAHFQAPPPLFSKALGSSSLPSLPPPYPSPPPCRPCPPSPPSSHTPPLSPQALPPLPALKASGVLLSAHEEGGGQPCTSAAPPWHLPPTFSGGGGSGYGSGSTLEESLSEMRAADGGSVAEDWMCLLSEVWG